MIQKLFVRDVRSAIVLMLLLENEMQRFRKLLSYFLNCIGLDALCILAQSLFKFTNFGTQVYGSNKEKILPDTTDTNKSFQEKSVFFCTKF